LFVRMSGSKSHTLKFLNTEKCIVKKTDNDGRVPTHTKMDGGSFHIPDGAMAGFYAAYGMDLHDGNQLFFIERNTPVFVLHFDVDFSTIEDEAKTAEFCTVLHAAASEWFKAPRTAVVCAVLADTGERKSAGLHVLFPEAFVDAPMACAIWAGVVARCEEKLPWGRGCWEKVLDVQVLAERGSLRMVGSDKSSTCHHCKGSAEEKKFCHICNGAGRIPHGKVYWPWRVFPETPESLRRLQDMISNQAHAVRACSVRSARETPSEDFCRPPGAPLEGLLKPSSGKKLKMLRAGNEKLPKAVKKFETLRLADDVLECLTRSIRAYEPQYESLVIRDVTKCHGGKHPYCFVRVQGFNDRFCLNKGSEHTSNQVWFLITTRGICQKCYSKKSEARLGGCPCQVYEGPPKKVEPIVLEALLGNPEMIAEAPAARAARRASSSSPVRRTRPRTAAATVCDKGAAATWGGFHQVTADPFI